MSQNKPSIGPGNPPPDAILMRMLFGGMIQQCISIVARLGIPDLVAQKPQSVTTLAKATKTNEDALYRLLRMLASVGVFSQNNAHEIGLTEISNLLRTDVANSLNAYAIMMSENGLWQNWGQMIYSVETGKTSQEKVHGMGSFEYLTQNPQAGEIFNRAMTSLSQADVSHIVNAYDFSSARKIVDIAGGQGLLLAGILKAYPKAEGILFDLPYTIEQARSVLKKEGVAGRVELLSGDFFESLPAGAAYYMMKHIINDWDDEHYGKIIENIRNSMAKNGKLLILEMVIPDGNEPSPSKFLDLQMLVTTGGRERTKEEFQKLLESAGFKLSRIVSTLSPINVIEAMRHE